MLVSLSRVCRGRLYVGLAPRMGRSSRLYQQTLSTCNESRVGNFQFKRETGFFSWSIVCRGVVLSCVPCGRGERVGRQTTWNPTINNLPVSVAPKVLLIISPTSRYRQKHHRVHLSVGIIITETTHDRRVQTVNHVVKSSVISFEDTVTRQMHYEVIRKLRIYIRYSSSF